MKQFGWFQSSIKRSKQVVTAIEKSTFSTFINASNNNNSSFLLRRNFSLVNNILLHRSRCCFSYDSAVFPIDEKCVRGVFTPYINENLRSNCSRQTCSIPCLSQNITLKRYFLKNSKTRKATREIEKLIRRAGRVRSFSSWTGKQCCWYCKTDLIAGKTSELNSESNRNSILFFCPNVECKKLQSIIPFPELSDVSNSLQDEAESQKGANKNGVEKHIKNLKERDQENSFYLYFYDLFDISWRPHLLRFDIDVKELEQKYWQIQKKLHPDNFKTSSRFEQELSQQNSSYINNAYHTLKNPITRAVYIMEQNGLPNPLKEEQQDTTKIDKKMLLDVMEAREVIEESTCVSELELFSKETQEEISVIYSELASCVKHKEYMNMYPLVIKLQYYKKLEFEATEKRNQLEDNLEACQ